MGEEQWRTTTSPATGEDWVAAATVIAAKCQEQRQQRQAAAFAAEQQWRAAAAAAQQAEAERQQQRQQVLRQMAAAQQIRAMQHQELQARHLARQQQQLLSGATASLVNNVDGDDECGLASVPDHVIQGIKVGATPLPAHLPCFVAWMTLPGLLSLAVPLFPASKAVPPSEESRVSHLWADCHASGASVSAVAACCARQLAVDIAAGCHLCGLCSIVGLRLKGS